MIVASEPPHALPCVQALNASTGDCVQAWFAVVTKPRSEAIAHEHLGRQGYECLFPRVRRMLRGAGGLRPRVECLFPSYVFLQADPDHKSLAPVRSTRGALGLVKFGGVPAEVPAAVIERIRGRMSADDGYVRLDSPDLEAGQAVRLTEGPLSGFEGVFVLREGFDRVRVLLELLGGQREIVVSRDQLAVRL